VIYELTVAVGSYARKSWKVTEVFWCIWHKSSIRFKTIQSWHVIMDEVTGCWYVIQVMLQCYLSIIV